MSDESLLMAKARDGDAKAFGALVQGSMRRAYRVALGLVGRHEDALDLSQDAFARAFRARRKLDPSRPFYPWYHQILRRLCFNHLRNRRRRAQKLRQASGWLVERELARQPQAPDREASRRQLRRKLEAAIESLPAHQREAFVLKEFEGLSYREIAELAGIPLGTVMSRLYAARKRLADELEEWR